MASARRRAPVPEGECSWLVIGAGPAGIATVGKLLDAGVPPGSMAWADPEFKVGDLGAKWSSVSSNTKVRLFRKFLASCKSFGLAEEKRRFALELLGPQETCPLEAVVEPLQWVTDRLRASVPTLQCEVSGIRRSGAGWRAQSRLGDVLARNVVLAIGAEPIRLNYGKPCISLEEALNPRLLRSALAQSDTVGVFGSSHSAIMAVHNLLDAGARRVINFYRSPLLYAVDHGDWILHDNTGLKGKTAEWARDEMERVPAERLLRVKADSGNVRRYLPECTKVVYGVGFKARRIPVRGADPAKYDDRLGVIAPGMFGIGIAYPERVIDRSGNPEYNVGLWKFAQYLDRVVPAWLQMSAEGVEEGVTWTSDLAAAPPRRMS